MGIEDPDAVVDLGEYRGFAMQLKFNGKDYEVGLRNHLTYSAVLSNEPVGNVVRINHALERIEEDLKKHTALHDRYESDMEAAKEAANQPFPKEAELQAKTERLNQLNHELENEHPVHEANEETRDEAETDEPQEYEQEYESEDAEEWAESRTESCAEPFQRDAGRQPVQSERKPSIRDQLHGYTPPARVAAPQERRRTEMML